MTSMDGGNAENLPGAGSAPGGNRTQARTPPLSRHPSRPGSLLQPIGGARITASRAGRLELISARDAHILRDLCKIWMAVVQVLPAQVWRTVITQTLLTLLLAALLLFYGRTEAISGLIGGLAAVAGNGFLGFFVFQQYRAQQPGAILGKYYLAEIAKLAMTALVFLLVILYLRPISIAAMLGIFLIVHLASGFLMVFFGRNTKKS